MTDQGARESAATLAPQGKEAELPRSLDQPFNAGDEVTELMRAAWGRSRSRTRIAEAKVRELLSHCGALRETRDELLAAVKEYVLWFGAAHTLGCPADDTCFCSGSAINDAINKAITKAEAASSGPQEPPK